MPNRKSTSAAKTAWLVSPYWKPCLRRVFAHLLSLHQRASQAVRRVVVVYARRAVFAS
jgi:hypothetical protein